MKLRHATTAILFSAATALTPGVLSAQFTTFVAPPRKAAVDSAKPTVAEAKTKADSVARMNISDMKAWVDSAAGASGVTQVANANDTTVAAANTAPVLHATGSANTTTTFSNGAIAPNTASPLPTYVVTGLTLIGFGFFLRRRRRTPDPVRVK